jgi:transposase-like protein
MLTTTGRDEAVGNDAHFLRRHRFLADVMRDAVWLCLRFTLSYREVENLLAERGLDVSYETAWRMAGGNRWRA